MKRRGTRFEALPGFPLAEMEAARTKLEAEGVDVILLPGGTLGAGEEGAFRNALTVTEQRILEVTQRLGRLLAMRNGAARAV